MGIRTGAELLQSLRDGEPRLSTVWRHAIARHQHGEPLRAAMLRKCCKVKEVLLPCDTPARSDRGRFRPPRWWDVRGSLAASQAKSYAGPPLPLAVWSSPVNGAGPDQSSNESEPEDEK